MWRVGLELCLIWALFTSPFLDENGGTMGDQMESGLDCGVERRRLITCIEKEEGRKAPDDGK